VQPVAKIALPQLGFTATDAMVARRMVVAADFADERESGAKTLQDLMKENTGKLFFSSYRG
jgi:hypothetical protein